MQRTQKRFYLLCAFAPLREYTKFLIGIVLKFTPANAGAGMTLLAWIFWVKPPYGLPE